MSRKPKFTPGPWLWEANHDDPSYTVWTRQPHTGELASVYGSDVNGKYPAKANAILMAAAPDMFGLLQNLLDAGMIVGIDDTITANARQAARDVLRKATGV